MEIAFSKHALLKQTITFSYNRRNALQGITWCGEGVKELCATIISSKIIFKDMFNLIKNCYEPHKEVHARTYARIDIVPLYIHT